MSAFNISDISESFYKQIRLLHTNVTLKDIQDAIVLSFHGKERRFDEIKVANGKLHAVMGKNLNIKRTQQLDMISRALGFENHHALKHALLSESNKQRPIRFDKDEHPLLKLYALKNDLSELFLSHDIYGINFQIHASKKEIHILMQTDQPYHRSTGQKAINTFLREHGLIYYKNFIVIPWAYAHEDTTPAALLIKKYKNFFYPIWDEIHNGELIQKYKTMPIITFSDIKAGETFLTVDGYSTDRPNQTIIAALEYGFKFGNKEFWQSLVEILTRPQMSLATINTERNFSIISDIERYEFKKTFGKLKGDSLDDIFDTYQRELFIFHLHQENVISIKEIEQQMGKDIGEFIKVYVLNHVKSMMKQSLFLNKSYMFAYDSFKKGYSEVLSGHTYSYLIDHSNDKYIFDMRNTINLLTSEIENHITLLRNAIINKYPKGISMSTTPATIDTYKSLQKPNNFISVLSGTDISSIEFDSKVRNNYGELKLFKTITTNPEENRIAFDAARILIDIENQGYALHGINIRVNI